MAVYKWTEKRLCVEVVRGLGVNEKRKKSEMMDNGVLGVPTAHGRNYIVSALRSGPHTFFISGPPASSPYKDLELIQVKLEICALERRPHWTGRDAGKGNVSARWATSL